MEFVHRGAVRFAPQRLDDLIDIERPLILACLRRAGGDMIVAQADRPGPLVAQHRRVLKRQNHGRPVLQDADRVLAQGEVAVLALRMHLLPPSLQQRRDRLHAFREAEQLAGKGLKPGLQGQQPQVARLLEEAVNRLDLGFEIDGAAIERRAGLRIQEALRQPVVGAENVIEIVVVALLVEIGATRLCLGHGGEQQISLHGQTRSQRWTRVDATTGGRPPGAASLLPAISLQLDAHFHAAVHGIVGVGHARILLAHADRLDLLDRDAVRQKERRHRLRPALRKPVVVASPDASV